MNNASDNTSFESRPVIRVVQGMATSDGAGVSLTRVIGTPHLDMLDPFLLLDNFRSDDPEDYIAGFPLHPHRGFETVTYLLTGHMQHEDNAGHSGTILSGGVQWMTAGRGIVHSEMPLQEDGLLSGFQLWVNLPASHKMIEPRYQEFGPEAIPTETRADGTTIKVIAGETSHGTHGPVSELITPVRYFDVTLGEGGRFVEPLPTDHNVVLFVIEGELDVVARGRHQKLRPDQLAQLGDGEGITVEGGGRFLLLAGRPVREPVARYGPFVMNTKEEIMQAVVDYQQGRF